MGVSTFWIKSRSSSTTTTSNVFFFELPYHVPRGRPSKARRYSLSCCAPCCCAVRPDPRNCARRVAAQQSSTAPSSSGVLVMAEPIPSPPAVSPVINLDGPGRRSPPASAGLLKDLLIPCCLAGSFLCALCETVEEASLLCSAQTAYTHLTKTHKANAATKEITQKLCVELYGWLRSVLPAGVWLDYASLDPPAGGQDQPPLPAVMSPRQYPPPLPGRSTKPGLICSKCSSCFSEQKSAHTT